MIDKTESAVETLRDAMTTRCGCNYFSMGAEDYRALLDRVIDAPTDANREVLHVGDEYSVWPNSKRVHVIEELSIDDDGRWYITVQRMPQGPDVTAYCSQVYKVVPDSRERIEADVEKDVCHYYGRDYLKCDGCPARNAESCSPVMVHDLVRRCFALMDGEGR